MKVSYGTPIEDVASAFQDDFTYSTDHSFDVLRLLALAYFTAKVMGETDVDLQFGNRTLVLPSIERAYREVLHLRKDMAEDALEVDQLTKFGRLVTNAKS